MDLTWSEYEKSSVNTKYWFYNWYLVIYTISREALYDWYEIYLECHGVSRARFESGLHPVRAL